MLRICSVIAALLVPSFAIVMTRIRRAKAALVLAYVQAAVTAVGIIGIIAVYAVFKAKIASSALSAEYVGWADDAFSNYFRILLIVTAAVALITASAALIGHRMLFGRCALASVAAVGIALASLLVASMTESASDVIGVPSFILLASSSASLMLSARGVVDALRLAGSLCLVDADRDKAAKKRKKRRK